ncbi:aspartyl protease family protein [Maribacter sp. 2308TA10-17]|uniref:aspartyl protease family protein n=1 Tax=Maribacter sp. 2308TA10-17 TaxID=3386276 RepID=UPI0039BD1F7D
MYINKKNTFHVLIQSMQFSTKRLVYLLVFTLLGATVSGQEGFYANGSMNMAGQTDTLKVKVLANGWLLTDVVINDKTYTFLLDSAGPTTLTTSVSGHFENITSRRIIDASNHAEMVNYVSIPKLTLGKTTFLNIAAMQFDIKLLKHHGIDGLLGANIMAKGIWDFDLRNERIIIHKNNAFQDFPYVSKITLQANGTPVIKAKYFNKVKENVWIDIGFDDLFSLNGDYFKKLEKQALLKNEVVGYGNFAQTAFGASSGKFHLSMINLGLGNLTIKDIPVKVDHNPQSKIGVKFFEHYRTVIDFINKRIYFKPYHNKIDSTYRTFGFKTKVNRQKKLAVAFVWNNSSAFEQGIKIDDVILSLNDLDLKTTPISHKILNKAYRLKKEKDSIVVEVNTSGNFKMLYRWDILKKRN